MKRENIKIEIIDSIALITLSGTIHAETIINTLGELFGNSDYVSGCSIWDFRKAEGESTFDEIRKIAKFAGEHRGKRPVGRVALIVSSELHFGLSRIYQVLTENLPFHLEIFKSFEQAREWVMSADTRSTPVL